MDNWDAEFYQSTDPEAPLYYDFTLTKTSRLNDLAPVLKEFTDRLVNTYQNGTDDQRARIDLCTANAMKVDNGYPFTTWDDISRVSSMNCLTCTTRHSSQA